MEPRIFHIHALSPLHCGVGQAAGIVDLPIARARASGLPIVPDSSIRGALRQHIEDTSEADARVLFGPRRITDTASAFAGAWSIGDAHLLLIPIRSLAGIVCYATSPYVLRRYRRDLSLAGISSPGLPALKDDNRALVGPASVNLIDGKLVLEDLDLETDTVPEIEQWARHVADTVHPDDPEAQEDLIGRVTVLPDHVLGYLAETATDIRNRIAIDQQTGTVRKGSLWLEENLPTEAILWGVHAIGASCATDDARDAAALAQCLPESDSLLQLGGKAGVGRGLIRLLFSEK